MATSDQIRALIKSHVRGDSETFKTLALQIAATEARKGHSKVAEDIRQLIDVPDARPVDLKALRSGAVSIARPRGELAELLSAEDSTIRLSSMVLEKRLSDGLERVINEQKNRVRIQSYGLPLRRRLLLVGPPGTGKTMTALAVAGELGIPLFTVRLDGLISRLLGESISKLRLIFDAIRDFRGVYFFDEFDSIGVRRDKGSDVGEMRRMLNSFLQYIEEDNSNSVIIAATNHPHLLDSALGRRFDDVLAYSLPDPSLFQRLSENTLANFKLSKITWKVLERMASGLSHASIVRACEEAAKAMLLEERKFISQKDLRSALAERIEHQKSL